MNQCQPRYSQRNEIQANTCTLMRSNVWHMHNGPCRSLLQETKMSPMESPKQGNSIRGGNIYIYVYILIFCNMYNIYIYTYYRCISIFVSGAQLGRNSNYPAILT